jgi:hypothetical protein
MRREALAPMLAWMARGSLRHAWIGLLQLDSVATHGIDRRRYARVHLPYLVVQYYASRQSVIPHAVCAERCVQPEHLLDRLCLLLRDAGAALVCVQKFIIVIENRDK